MTAKGRVVEYRRPDPVMNSSLDDVFQRVYQYPIMGTDIYEQSSLFMTCARSDQSTSYVLFVLRVHSRTCADSGVYGGTVGTS